MLIRKAVMKILQRMFFNEMYTKILPKRTPRRMVWGLLGIWRKMHMSIMVC